MVAIWIASNSNALNSNALNLNGGGGGWPGMAADPGITLYKPPPLPYQPMTEMAICLYLNNHYIFWITILWLDRLDARLSSDIYISREILEIGDY
jgi:hypothetical protein